MRQHRDKDFFKKEFKNNKSKHEENTDIFDFYAYDRVLSSNKIIKGKCNEQYQTDHALPSP